MKKLLTKFWGVGLVIILLSTLFVGTAAPVAAADYDMTNTLIGPATIAFGGPLAPVTNFGIVDVAQSGSTIYALAGNTTAGYFALYKSTNGGATWAAVTTGIVAAAQTFAYVAVAPDDPNIVCIVDTAPAPDVVYLSTTGGTLMSALGTGTVAAINSIDISPLALFRYITVGGAAGVSTWTLGLVAPTWSAADATIGPVVAVKYSSNFAADAGLIAVSNNAAGVGISVYSRNLLAWNPTGYGYPRVITATAGNTINKAVITLDPNFYLGDDATQIGFIGIGSANATAINGVHRFDVGIAGTVAQIFATTGVNSIAWDGTNLMVAPYDVAAGAALTIYRSANPLAIAVAVAFLPSSTFKTPGTGTLPLVLFNGGVGYAFSRGPNSAVAKTTDNGKSFNGFALINSNFNTISDFWVSADASRLYAVVNDGTDINVWRRDGAVWQRVMVISGVVTPNWLIRADADTPDTVYIAAFGGTTMYKALDAGDVTWTTRASPVAVADFVVQDANTLYLVTGANANVYKSTNGAFTWTPTLAVTGALGGAGFSLTAIGDNQLIMATTTGGIAYTTDGAAWTAIPFAAAAGPTVTAASALTAGSIIWAGTNVNATAVNSWIIGTSVAWTGAAGTANVTGLVMADGVVYALNSNAAAGAADYIYRFLAPAFGAGFIYEAIGPTTDVAVTQGASSVNTLQAVVGSVVLWARSNGTPDIFVSYKDSLTSAANAPAPTYPIDGTKIQVNSISGFVGNFVFQWNAPALLATKPAQLYTYQVGVYLDELATIQMGLATGVAASIGGVGTSYNQAAFNAGAGLALQPGTTYYWRVRTWAPVLSQWSAMQNFTVQQLQAIVPTLASPQQGASINVGQTAAFAWSPIVGTQTYQFEVSTDPTFATTIYSTTTTSAGASLPASVKLTAGTTYFWRVKALTPTEGDFSTVGNFVVAAPPTTTPPPAVVTPTTTVTSIVIPPATSTIITVPPDVTETTVVSPAYIWAIIIIGAVLVIAVIILIVRTRRSV